MKKYLPFSLFFGIIILVSSCRYDDQPFPSFRPAAERVSNVWEVKVGFENLEDRTEDFDLTWMEYFEDGRVEFYSRDTTNDTTYVQEGLWFLVNKKKEIEVHYTEPLQDPDRQTFRILRLNENEMWLEYDVDTSLWEIRLIPYTGQYSNL